MKRMNKVNTDPNAVDEVLSRGVAEVILKDHLRERMRSGEVLRIKFGIDPTSPHTHLGHTVPLRKLRQFQDLGHQAVLIIGDFTAMIGDPTGRSEERNRLSKEEVKKNQKTYLKQAGKILDLKKLEVRHNGDWFFKMSSKEFFELTSLVTIQQVMQREDFRKRVDDPKSPLSTMEVLYPVLQGYDSVMVKADVEIGGVDQTLNLHMGRRIQRRFGIPEQDIMTVPIIEGTDGERKMSKSFDNAIYIESAPEELYAKTMSIPDTLIRKYFNLLSDLSENKIQQIMKQMKEGGNPRDAKARLAWELVRMYHSAKEADKATAKFDKMFKQHEIPSDNQMIQVNLHALSSAILIDALVSAGVVSSRSDARRQIEQGAVKVDGKIEKNPLASIQQGSVIQKGKRYFVKIVR